MDNQRLFELWTDFKKNIWQRMVQTGRKHAVLRAGLLAVVAVGLFFRHLMKYMQATPVRRFVSVCCAGALVLNSVYFPIHVWATEQEESAGNWVVDEMEGDDTRGLIFEVKRPAEPVIEGYEGLIQYQVKIINPVNGEDLSVNRVQADSAEVYLVTEDGEQKLEDGWIEAGEGSSTEEGSEEPSTEEGSEEPSTEEGSEEPSTEEGSEEPSTEEGSEEPSTEEGSEEPSTEEGSEEPSTEEGSEEPSTEENSEEPSTEEESGEPSTEENSEEPSIEEGSEEPSIEEDGENSPAEESGETPSAEDGGVTDADEGEAGETIVAAHMVGAHGTWNLPAGGEMRLNLYFETGLSAGAHERTLMIWASGLDVPIVKILAVSVNAVEEDSESSEAQPDTQEETEQEGGTEGTESPAGPSEGTEEPANPSGGGTGTEEPGTEEGTEEPASPSEGGTGTEEPGTEEGTEEPASPSEGETGTEEPGTEEGTEEPASPSEGETGTEEPGTEEGTEMPDMGNPGGDDGQSSEPSAEDTSQGGSGTGDSGIGDWDSEGGAEGTEIPEEPLEEEPSEDLEAETPEEEPKPKMEVLSRDGGFYMGNTFFAVTGTVFELAVDQETVAALFCELDGETEELAIEDGNAFFAIPETCDGMLRFYTLDEEGNVNGELTEYVIAETEAPILDYMNVTSSTDKKEMVRITIEDCGDVISGLNEIRCEVDGVPYTEYMTEVFGRATLSSGEKVISGISFDIPLTDIEIHTIAVYASDQVGNILEKKFRVHSSQRDIVSVVLPTSFGMAIFPYSSNGNIWGDDIVIANQGDFPIEVTLKSAQINIDHANEGTGIDKDAELSLNMLLSEGRDSKIDLAEGYSKPGTCFVLGPKNPKTDAEALQNDKREKQVESEDYAIVNVRGVISEGSERFWKTGDITVSLTFTFKRLEEEDEVIE